MHLIDSPLQGVHESRNDTVKAVDEPRDRSFERTDELGPQLIDAQKARKPVNLGGIDGGAFQDRAANLHIGEPRSEISQRASRPKNILAAEDDRRLAEELRLDVVESSA